MTLNHENEDHGSPLEAGLPPETLLPSLDQDAPAADPAELERLRERLRPAFHNAAKLARNQLVPNHQRNLNRALPGLTVLAAALAILIVAFVLTPTQAQHTPTLGEVIARLERSKALEISIQQDNIEQRLQYLAPGIVRWSDGADSYRIADGRRLWKIDESTGTVEEQQSPLPEEGVTALSWLELTGVDRRKLEHVRPSGTESIDGQSLLVYSATATWKSEPVEIRAYVEPSSQDLQLLRLVRNESPQPQIAAEIRLTRLEASTAESLFEPRKSLRNDGRSGIITDVQGLVTVRAFPGHRWTPAFVGLPVFAGDQFQCEAAGPHAVKLQSQDASELLAGPGARFEIKSNGSIRLLHGEFRISPGPDSRSTSFAGPDDSVPAALQQVLEQEKAGDSTEVTHTFVRVTADTKSVDLLTTVPRWFESLKETLTPETLGSLVTQIEGRDTSLTIGYHHVSVEIRDQIAKTVIEESFVNNTAERLEGQFQFPLPADASISGFGMWIGNELIEADIVEKQRAREIFEIIRHENRDPGLLEWMGSNLFKARVFPIEPHSEKRIRITYTQTLPLLGKSFRYRYPLRSEMLRKNPLRDLSIDVTMYSERSLADVESMSHPLATIDVTPHAARFHWDARNVTPGNDFELTCQLEDKASDVTVIPYLKDEQGYFMVQLTPPSRLQGDWSRPLVADGTPLDVVILCDTSQSMGSESRRLQQALVEALLRCLADSDKVRLACCDGELTWLQKEAQRLTPESRQALPRTLDQRVSLGWSDLQSAFEQVTRVADANTVIVYLGDGSVITDDAGARSRFLTWLSARGSSVGPQPTIHAIGTSGTADDVVLNAISRCGRGTSRILSDSVSPESAIRELLLEVSRPGLKQIQVEFRNVDVAAVYPRELPNLQDGQQHLLFGRFLPTKQNHKGELLISGLLGTERVKYAAQFTLPQPIAPENSATTETDSPVKTPADDIGQNSFIPRQWAQAHIDHLLAEPPSSETRSRIIALSEQFHLITPFTSLLVLETDADRERFGVRKSIQVEDGEEFFAEGRQEAEYTMRQLEIEKAKLWRSQMLARFQSAIRNTMPLEWPAINSEWREETLRERTLDESLNFDVDFARPLNSWSTQVQTDGPGLHWSWQKPGQPAISRSTTFWADLPQERWYRELSKQPSAEEEFLGRSQAWDADVELSMPELFAKRTIRLRIDDRADFRFGTIAEYEYFNDDYGLSVSRQLQESNQSIGSRYHFFESEVDDLQRIQPRLPAVISPILSEAPVYGITQMLQPRQRSAVNSGSPDLIANLCDSVFHRVPLAEDNSESDIIGKLNEAGANELASILSLLSGEPVPASGGLVIHRQSDSLHPRNGSLLRSDLEQTVWQPEVGWLLLESDRGPGSRNVYWSIGQQSGVLNRVTTIGRVTPFPTAPTRCASPIKLNIRAWDFLPPGDLDDLRWKASISPSQPNQTEVLVWNRLTDWTRNRILIDTEKKSVLQFEQQVDGTTTWEVLFQDHTLVGETWIPRQQIERRWDQRTGILFSHQVHTLQIEPYTEDTSRNTVDLEVIAQRLSQSMVGDDPFPYQLINVSGVPVQLPGTYVVIRSTQPTLEESRRRIDEKSAEPEHVLAVAANLVHQGRFTDARALLTEELQQRKLLAASRWLVWSISSEGRSGEEYARETVNFARKLLPQLQQSSLDPLLITHLWQATLNLSSNRMSRADRIQLLEDVEQYLQSVSPLSEVRYEILTEQMQLFSELRQHANRRKVAMEIRDVWGHELRAHLQLIEWLQQQQRAADVLAAFDHAISDSAKVYFWTADDLDTLFGRKTQWHRERGEYAEALATAEQWIEMVSASAAAHEQYLRSLIDLDRTEQIHNSLKDWFSQSNQKWTPQVEARLAAAMTFAMGRVGELSLAGPQKEYYRNLFELSENWVTSIRHHARVSAILTHQPLWDSLESEQVSTRILKRLTESIKDVPNAHLQEIQSWIPLQKSRNTEEYGLFVQQLRGHVDELLGSQVSRSNIQRLSYLLFDLQILMAESTSAAKREEWFRTLLERLKNEPNLSLRQLLYDLIFRFDSAAFSTEHQLATLRSLVEQARTPQERTARSRQLFAMLTNAQAWSQAHEDEAWSMIDQCIESPSARIEWLNEKLGLLKQWLSFAEAGYRTSLQSQSKEWNKLSSRQQETLQSVFSVQAQLHALQLCTQQCEGVRANRVPLPNDDKLSDEQTESLNHRMLQQWWLVQKLQFMKSLVRSESTGGFSKEQKAAFLIEIRGLCEARDEDQPATAVIDLTIPEAPENQLRRSLQSLDLKIRNYILQSWIFAVFELQHVEPDDQQHQQANQERILTYLRRGQQPGTDAQKAYQAAEFVVLVTFDRLTELETNMRRWMSADGPNSVWRVYLAQLLAELDRLEEAVRLYEEAGERDLLTASQWQQLALWQHALDRRSDSEASKRAAVLHASTDVQIQDLEQRLAAWLNEPQTRTPAVSAEIRQQIETLARSSSEPDRVISIATRWYSSTHDPLVLKPLVGALAGRSSNNIAGTVQRIQTCLASMEYQAGLEILLREVHRLRKSNVNEEASQKLQTEVDRRALMLVELVIIARNADLNSKATSEPSASASILREFNRVLDELLSTEWNSEDRIVIGNLLSSTATISSVRPSIARSMRVLIQQEEIGSANRFVLVSQLAALYRNQNETDSAQELLEAELRQTLSASVESSGEFDSLRRELFAIFQAQNRFIRWEQWLRELRPTMGEDEYLQNEYALQLAALNKKSELSIGAGIAIYQSLRDSLLRQLRDPGRTGQLQQNFSLLISVFREGTAQKFDSVDKDINQFIQEDFDRIRRLQSSATASMVSQLADMLTTIAHREDAAKLIMDQIEKPPVAIQWTRPRELWASLMPSLIDVSYKRTDPSPEENVVRYALYPGLKHLRASIEATVTNGLQIHLQAGDAPPEIVLNDALISTFEGRSEAILSVFAAVANQRPQREEMIKWLADLIATRMPNHQRRAISILEQAHQDRLLSVSGKQQLATLYSRNSDWENAVKILSEITLETHEATPHYELMQAYFQLGNRTELLTQFQLIRSMYIDPDTADLSSVRGLADHCLAVELWNESAGLYETILKRAGDQPYPDGRISMDWRNLGLCYAHLGQSEKILRTSAMAWLTCGNDASQRSAVEESLRHSLQILDDLKPIIDHWEQQCAVDNADSSLIRRSLAADLLNREQFGEAEKQLRIAIELQPLDSQLWSMLIRSLDGQTNRQIDAINVLLEQTGHFPNDLTVFTELHDRGRKLNLTSLAARAAQSIIECGPEEAANFRSLATLRSRSGDQESELRLLQRAADLRTEDPTLLIELCTRLIDAERRVEARRVLSKLAQGTWNPQYGDVKAKLPEIRQKLNRRAPEFVPQN